MARAWSVKNVKAAKFTGLPFTGKWKKVIGIPERAYSWIIWGQSGSGKTTFIFQLAKYLSHFEKVLINSLEEGLSLSIQAAYDRAELTEKDAVILVKENMDELRKRLKQHKSPNIVFIDSVKYTRFRWNDYEAFCSEFPHKLFIWIAHAKGKEPKGALAEDIRYDAFVKIYTEGFRAFITSRFKLEGDASTMDIYKEAARKYWGE